MEEKATVLFTGLSPASTILLLVGFVVMVVCLLIYGLCVLQHRKKRNDRRFHREGMVKIDPNSTDGQNLLKLNLRLNLPEEDLPGKSKTSEKP